MAKFKITWPDKTSEEVVQGDCKTVEQYLMCRFGDSRHPDTVVELVEEAVQEATKPVKTAKAK